MNLWRWLGISIFMLVTLCLIGTTNYVGGQDKKDVKKEETKKEEPKKEETKKEEPKKEVKKEEPKKEEPKKEEPKKEEPKKEVSSPKGDLTFSAFDPKSKTFYQKQYTKTTQKMKVMGQEVIQEQTQTFVIEWTPKDKDKDGNYVVEQQIRGVKMDINIGGNKISYDSTSPNKQKNPMTDFFEQLTKSKLTFTINKDFSKVVKIEGRDDFIKGLSDINPQMQSLLKAILSDNALAKMAEPTWYAFPPNGAIPTTKTWPRDSVLDLGPIGKYKTNFEFKYAGEEKGKDKIDITTKLEYTAPTEKAGLPFIIHSAKLTADKGTGQAIFDRSKGRFESTEIAMKLTGTLEIEVGSMKTTVELTQDQTARSDTLDTLPDEWKAAVKQ